MCTIVLRFVSKLRLKKQKYDLEYFLLDNFLPIKEELILSSILMPLSSKPVDLFLEVKSYLNKRDNDNDKHNADRTKKTHSYPKLAMLTICLRFCYPTYIDPKKFKGLKA